MDISAASRTVLDLQGPLYLPGHILEGGYLLYLRISYVGQFFVHHLLLVRSTGSGACTSVASSLAHNGTRPCTLWSPAD